MSPRLVQEGTTAHRRYLWGSWTLFVVVALLVPFVFAETWAPTIAGDKYTIGMDNIVHSIAWMVAVLGLNLLIGYSGQISLGHSFFVGLGAYLAGVLIVDNGWPWPLTFVAVIPVCFAIGMLVGIPALRIKGLYLALVTLVLATIFPTLVRLEGLADRTGGSNGLTVRIEHHPPDWLPLNGIAEFLQAIPLVGGYFGEEGVSSREEDRLWKFMIFVIIAAVCFWMVKNIVRSRPGRAMRAIRDNETGAAVSGVNLALTKTMAFGVASALGGVGGVVYVMELGIAAPLDFTQLLAINFVVGLVVGGVGTQSGAVIGGFVIAFVPDWASSTESIAFVPERWLDGPTGTLFLGVMLIVLTFFLPGGIAQWGMRTKAKFLRVVPRSPVPQAAMDAGAPAPVEESDEEPVANPA